MPTLDASSPSPVYGDTAANTSLVTASFTPPSGSVVIAKVSCNDGGQTISSVTGLTFTNRVEAGAANGARSAVFTAAGAGSAVTVTAAFAGSANRRGLVVEVWTSAQLAATPATDSVFAGGGAPSRTITTVAAGSVVSWVSTDWNGVDGASRAYRSSAVETAYHLASVGSITIYDAYQAAASAGSQTYGLTAPTGQQFTMAAIEVQDSGGAVDILPEITQPPRRAT